MKPQLSSRAARSLLGAALALSLGLMAVAPVPAASPNAAAAVNLQAAQDLYHVRVDGVPMTADPQLVNRGGTVYASLRALAQAIVPNAQVSWTGNSATVNAAGVLTLTAVPGQNYLVANGRYLYVPGGVVAQSGSVLAPLTTLLQAMDATCRWNSDGSLDITTGSGGILSGDQFYNANDLKWLSQIIYAESGNQPMAGKIAVGNVVLNRVRSPLFPNSVYAVIFQKNQFSPAASGSVYRAPSAESVVAAKLCLDGAVALEDVLYFNRVGLRCWASRNRAFVATIAGHSFYA